VIFVDSSVWVASFRSAAGGEARHLALLLEDDLVGLPSPVRIEILSGASAQDRLRLRRVLSALPTFYPTLATWERMEGWLDRASAAGQRFGAMDLLIGALAAERGAAVWSLDSDFRRMEALGLVELYHPRAA
jgi:predicted nucleic acid-binding protein